jgi:uncharacterized protein (DUF885 family)
MKLTTRIAVLLSAFALPVLPAVAQMAATPPAAVVAQTEDAKLTVFLDGEFAEYLKAQPELATQLGLKTGGDRWTEISDAAAQANVEWRKASVARMQAQFPRASLSPAAQVNFDIWALEAERAAQDAANRINQPPFHQWLYPLQARLPNFLINAHRVTDVTDLRHYIARLRGIPAVLDEGVALSRKSDAAGVHSPRFQIEAIIASATKLTSGAPFDAGPDSALWADVKAKTEKLVAAGTVGRAEADALLAEARAAILALKPGYARLIDWARGNLASAPSGKLGALTLPGGAEFYASALKLSTTTDLTAAQIHAIGRKEVARIEAEQDALAQKAGFKDRKAYYAERERLLPKTPYDDAARAAYLQEANRFVNSTRALLPGWFGLLPAYDIIVVREAAFSEIPGGAAHASFPSPDGKTPGRTYVHLVGTQKDPAHVYTLMCHEAIPGHNYQGDIQARQQAGPKFRAVAFYNAFTEGWALYAERLCNEMGAFPDVAADFFRLDSELFRAARLVTDTGIHELGWTEDEAVKYLHETGRAQLEMARSEVRRYITWPGQATGYKIGMLKIMEMRTRAEAALGPKFDIRGFHDLLVDSGSQPLSIMERRVDDWIAARK